MVSLLVAAPAVLRRPDLWTTALRQWWRLTPARWWRRRPYLPVPDRDWMRFRFETQYGGDGTGPVVAEDVVQFLAWCRDMRRSERTDW